MINTIILLIMILSILFITIKHPLSIVILIILQTLIIRLIIGIIIKSFWFSYIIIIIIIRGILVLFIYIARIASNEKFEFSIKIIFIIPLILTFMLFIKKTQDLPINLNNLNLTLQNLFNFPSIILTIIIIIYLLFSIIVVSKIVNIHEGPLRIKK